jgi:hypothetical protein
LSQKKRFEMKNSYLTGLIVLSIFVVSLLSPSLAHAHNPLYLRINEPVGHSVSFRSVMVVAPHGMTLRYHYSCTAGKARMTIRVVKGNAGYSPLTAKNLLTTFTTWRERQDRGTFFYTKGGFYRLDVSLSPECSWSMDVLA